MNALADKVALITGAAGAIGQATTAALAKQGCKVAMVDILDLDVDPAADSGQTLPIKADLSQTEAIPQVIRQIEAELGPVDILVNNAGLLSNNKAAETTYEEWRRIFSVNVDAAFLLSQGCLPAMRRKGWGRIINICSLAIKTGGLTAGTAYTASKGALSALTFSLARETAGDGITVNGLAPAHTRSRMVTEQLTEEQRQKLVSQIPVGRICEPDEVAWLIAFLASPNSGFITGELIDINGGVHLD